ncbi:hypothetical protein Tco_0063901, partial [Tanacetum coccineum]
MVKAYQIYLCCYKDWTLLLFDVAISFDAAILDVAATVSAACIVAAGYIVSAGICDAAVSADYVPAGHVLISADRYRI